MFISINETNLENAYKWNQSVVFLSMFFFSAQCFHGSPLSKHVSKFHSFLRLNNIQLYISYTFFPLSLIDGHELFPFVNWILLLWTLVYKWLFKSLFSILFGIQLSRIAGSNGNSMFNFWGTAQWFSASHLMAVFVARKMIVKHLFIHQIPWNPTPNHWAKHWGCKGPVDQF